LDGVSNIYLGKNMSKCPVVLAINEIKGGFDWSGNQSNDINTISIYKGGRSKNVTDDFNNKPQAEIITCVLEDAIFYITSRKLALARLKLGKPDLKMCKQFYAREFENRVGKDYYDVYVEI